MYKLINMRKIKKIKVIYICVLVITILLGVASLFCENSNNDIAYAEELKTNSENKYTEISTTADFAKINANPSGNYCLTNNITFDVSCSSIPEFTGVFNGNGYTIHNWGYVPIFLNNEGVIENLCIDVNQGYYKIYFKEHCWGAIASYNQGTIKACYTRGNIGMENTNTENYSQYYLGFIVGYNIGTIQNCGSTLSVGFADKYTEKQETLMIGGISGCNAGNIENCVYDGTMNIVSYREALIGGIIGLNATGGKIDKCATYNCELNLDKSKITKDFHVGGICGNALKAEIMNCFSSTHINISGNYESGYINVGGLIGSAGECKISNCYILGRISPNISNFNKGYIWLSGYIANSNQNNSNNIFISINVTNGFELIPYKNEANNIIMDPDRKIVFQNAKKILDPTSWEFISEEYILLKSNLYVECDDLEKCIKIVDRYRLEINENTNTFFNFEVGNNRIQYKINKDGVNKIIYDRLYVIEPKIEGIENDKIYMAYVVPNIIGGNITLDGKEYDGKTKINEPGNHEIKITGVNQYIKTILFEVQLVYSDIENNGEYYNLVVPKFSCDRLYLNGEVYINETPIDKVGNYELKILGVGNYEKILKFKILPTIKNITDNGEYQVSVTPIINNVEMQLDGLPYISGTEINEIGNHKISIKGVGNYVKNINFKVIPKITGLIEGKEYDDAFSPIFSGGEITINGEPFIEGARFNIAGEYCFNIKGVNEYEDNIRCSIKELYPTNIDKKTFCKNDVVINHNMIATINGTKLERECTIDKIGQYNIKFEDINGNKKNVAFEIVPVVYEETINKNNISIEIKEIHDDSILKFDGVKITDNIDNNMVGYHTFSIQNGEYSKDIRYTLYDNCDIKDNFISNKPIDFNIDNAKVYLDGVEVKGQQLVDINGKHTLLIKGENGYKRIINFTYSNPYYTIIIPCGIVVSLMFIAAIVIMIKRRKLI